MIGRRAKPSTVEADKPKGFDDFELRLGDLMRGERATLGKSLLDVQRELRIKATYIAAIENADVSAFETPGFIAGNVRSYARYLGMDPDWAFRKFCHEANFTVAHGMSAAASSPEITAKRSLKESSDPLFNPNAAFIPRSEGLLSRIEPGAVGSLLVLAVLIGAIGVLKPSLPLPALAALFAAAGFALITVSMSVFAFSRSLSGPNETLPTGAWMIAVLSTRNSTLPALVSLIAVLTSFVTVPVFGFGIKPRGPNTLPSLPTERIISGVAITAS